MPTRRRVVVIEGEDAAPEAVTLYVGSLDDPILVFGQSLPDEEPKVGLVVCDQDGLHGSSPGAWVRQEDRTHPIRN